MNENIQPYSRVAFTSHMFIGIVGASAALLTPIMNSFAVFGLALGGVGLAAYCASRYCAMHLERGFELIEQSVAASEKPAGDTEFHWTAIKLVDQVSRLAAAAAKGREQSREVEGVLAVFDRRGSRDAKSNPARHLTLLLKSLGTETQAAMSGMSSVEHEMQGLRDQMVSAAKEELELVKLAAEEIRSVARDVEAVSDCAKQSKECDATAVGKSEGVTRRLLDLHDRLDQLREQVGVYDNKNQSVRDQLSEVASLMETIRDYSEKANTMALNASIESVRAGEHGLAFAAAADEIRKLTSVVSDSTGDAVDRLKLLEDGVKDAAETCSERQSTVEDQVMAVRQLCESVSLIRQSTNESRQHLDRLLELSETELRNLNVIANALGGVFESAERTSAQLGEEERIRRRFQDQLMQLSVLLSPLRTVSEPQLGRLSHPPTTGEATPVEVMQPA